MTSGRSRSAPISCIRPNNRSVPHPDRKSGGSKERGTERAGTRAPGGGCRIDGEACWPARSPERGADRMTAEPRDDEAAPPAEKTPEKSPEEIQVGIIPGPVPADPR